MHLVRSCFLLALVVVFGYVVAKLLLEAGNWQFIAGYCSLNCHVHLT